MLLQEMSARPAAAPSDTERVLAAIARLTPMDRDLVVLRFRNDSTMAELAAATGASTAVVQQRLHRSAWLVEDAVGPMPAGHQRTAVLGVLGRPIELVEEEALLGITPVLAARLVAAVGGDTLPAADQHWRWHALVGALRRFTAGGSPAATVLR
jgi:hypothetical protein